MSSDSRRRVNFSDSPPGGSKSSSRHNSDSGVGSSDHRPTASASAGANPDRGFTERDVERQWNDLGALQVAYRALYDSEKRMKLKLRDLEEENSRLRRRNIKEDETRWRDQHDEIQNLKDERDKYDSDRKLLAEENGQLKGKNNSLVAQLDEYAALVEDLERQLKASPVPEVMSGALPRDAERPKMKRRGSVSKKREEKEAAKEDKKRLSKRFELNKDEKEVSKPPNSSRTRRQSYIEPLGPAPPSRSSGSIPPSPVTATAPTSRQFPNYREASFRETSYSDLPRTVHPSVLPSVTLHEPAFDEGVAWQEDGNYHPYPLPKPPKSRPHSKYPS